MKFENHLNSNYRRDISVQRCRIHKLRNVLDHLPEEKKAQAAWRLRRA